MSVTQFLDLPGELRELIYKEYVDSASLELRIPLSNASSHWRTDLYLDKADEQGKYVYPSLVAVSHQLREECLESLVPGTKLIVNKSEDFFQDWATSIKPKTPAAILQGVKSLEVYYDGTHHRRCTDGEHHATLIRPFLSDLPKLESISFSDDRYHESPFSLSYLLEGAEDRGVTGVSTCGDGGIWEPEMLNAVKRHAESLGPLFGFALSGGTRLEYEMQVSVCHNEHCCSADNGRRDFVFHVSADRLDDRGEPVLQYTWEEV